MGKYLKVLVSAAACIVAVNQFLRALRELCLASAAKCTRKTFRAEVVLAMLCHDGGVQPFP